MRDKKVRVNFEEKQKKKSREKSPKIESVVRSFVSI